MLTIIPRRWLFVAGRLRVQTEHNGDALTLPDYFSSRFEDKSGVLQEAWVLRPRRFSAHSFALGLK